MDTGCTGLCQTAGNPSAIANGKHILQGSFQLAGQFQTCRIEFYLNAIEEAFVPQASVKSSLCRFCLDEKGMENIIYGVENRE